MGCECKEQVGKQNNPIIGNQTFVRFVVQKQNHLDQLERYMLGNRGKLGCRGLKVWERNLDFVW